MNRPRIKRLRERLALVLAPWLSDGLWNRAFVIDPGVDHLSGNYPNPPTLYARTNADGKTELVARFDARPDLVLAQEP